MALRSMKKSALLSNLDISAVSSENANGISSQSEKSIALLLLLVTILLLVLGGPAVIREYHGKLYMWI